MAEAPPESSRWSARLAQLLLRSFPERRELEAFLDEFRAPSASADSFWTPLRQWFAALGGGEHLVEEIIKEADDDALEQMLLKLQRLRPLLAPQLGQLRTGLAAIRRDDKTAAATSPTAPHTAVSPNRPTGSMGAVQPLTTPPSPHAAPAPGKGAAGGSSPAKPGQPESRDVGTSSPPLPPQRVSLGFSTPALPALPISAERSLAAGARHLFWVELAPELVVGSLLPAPPALPSLRPGDELDVILFPFPDQLVLEGARHGRLQLGGAGARVVKPAAEPEALPGQASTRLYFAVRTPDKPGRFALRCNLYCRGVLLQSHLVSVEVAERPRRHPRALRRALDYNLSTGLDTRRLTPSDDCRLSLFINDDDHGTHSFRFVSSRDGAPEQIADAHLEGSKLNEMIDYARGALRWSAWGTEAPWRPGEACKFSSVRDPAQLSEALILMAKRGANLWMELAAQFSFVGPGAHQLREHMRAPGRVQIALKDSPDAVIPAALLYDHPLDAARSHVSLCPASLAAIAAGKPLAGEPCFLGYCPSYADTSVVCPAGFWGFRHDLGLPLHLPGGEVATTIPRGE
jgi:hypothetical protein